MKTKLTNLLFSLLLATLLVPFAASAATGGQGLTISPPLSDITLNPGETVTRVIKINNPTSNLIEVYPRTMNFKASGETGEPAFYDVGDSSEKFALASWVSFDKSKIALAPEQVMEFQYKITVPTDAEPGGHYGAVFFANDPLTSNTNTSQVSMGSMIGSLLLVRIPGQITEKGFLEGFSSDKFLYLSNKVNLSTRISNLGNIHFKPLGNVIVKDMFGREVDSVVFNDQGGNVLPSSTRKFATNYQSSKFLLGYYKADMKLAYGQNAESLSASTGFWVIPLWFMILSLVLIALFVGSVVWLVLRNKKPRRPKSPKPPVQPPRPIQQTPQPRPQGSEPKGPIILR